MRGERKVDTEEREKRREGVTDGVREKEGGERVTLIQMHGSNTSATTSKTGRVFLITWPSESTYVYHVSGETSDSFSSLSFDFGSSTLT